MDLGDFISPEAVVASLKIKNKKQHVKGRCSQCKWLDVCAGNFRVRAEAMTGDLWAPDPACYLTDGEIGIE